jgi:glutaminase
MVLRYKDATELGRNGKLVAVIPALGKIGRQNFALNVRKLRIRSFSVIDWL